MFPGQQPVQTSNTVSVSNHQENHQDQSQPNLGSLYAPPLPSYTSNTIDLAGSTSTSSPRYKSQKTVLSYGK